MKITKTELKAIIKTIILENLHESVSNSSKNMAIKPLVNFTSLDGAIQSEKGYPVDDKEKNIFIENVKKLGMVPDFKSNYSEVHISKTDDFGNTERFVFKKLISVDSQTSGKKEFLYACYFEETEKVMVSLSQKFYDESTDKLDILIDFINNNLL